MKETTIHNCEIIRDLLPGYAEQLLSRSGMQAVRDHLDRCPDCQKIHEQMQKEVLETTPSLEDRRALDGFRKIRRRTRHLKLLAAGTLILMLSGVLCGFLMLFVIGKPAGTSWIDFASCSYDEETDSLTIQGHAGNLNIQKVLWEEDDSENTLINVLVYETEALPFTAETHDFTITIPDIKGRDVCLACPNYDRTRIYSWRDDHYELIEQMEEAIRREIDTFDPERNILYCYPYIYDKDGRKWPTFHADRVTGENASWWYWGDRIVTDGDLEPTGYEIWVSLSEPRQILFYDYRNGEWIGDPDDMDMTRTNES